MKRESINRIQIISGAQGSEAIVDKHWHEHFDVVWTTIEETCSAINNCSESISTLQEEKHNVISFMLVNIISDITSAALSARQGFVRPPLVVLRAALENLAVVVTIYDDDEQFSKFKTENFDVPKAISKAKNRFPEIGRLYGLATQNFAHEQYRSVGRAVGTHSGNHSLMLVPSVEKTPCKENFLLILTLAWYAHLTGQIAEWCFTDYLRQYIYWIPHGDGSQLKEKPTAGKKKTLIFLETFASSIGKTTR